MVSRIEASLVTRGPDNWKAMILSESGSIIGAETNPTGLPVWTLKTGVLMRLLPVTNISLL